MLDNYRAEAAVAYRDGETETAELWMRKVAMLDRDGPETQFNHALMAMQTGDTQRAEEIIDRLAPDNEVGFASAHLLTAQRLMQTLDSENAGQVRELRHHLGDRKSVV